MNRADFKKLADKLKNAKVHPIKIDKLTNENWLDWNCCMSSKLRIAHLWTMVNTEFDDDIKQTSEYVTLNRMATDQIILNVDIPIRPDLCRFMCAREMWAKLRDRFEGDDDQTVPDTGNAANRRTVLLFATERIHVPTGGIPNTKLIDCSPERSDSQSAEDTPDEREDQINSRHRQRSHRSALMVIDELPIKSECPMFRVQHFHSISVRLR